MARPHRLQASGAHYHLISRGNGRQTVYLDDADRWYFLSIAERVRARFDWGILAYCLMGNHYHLFVQTPSPTLSEGMRLINSGYAQWFNRRHGRVGHVFQGRYTAVLVDNQSYYLELIRYIALNPVRKKLCNTPEDWRWSSHRAMFGSGPGALSIQVARVLAAFGSVDMYRAFVHRPIKRDEDVLGSPEFVRDVLMRRSD